MFGNNQAHIGAGYAGCIGRKACDDTAEAAFVRGRGQRGDRHAGFGNSGPAQEINEPPCAGTLFSANKLCICLPEQVDFEN